LHDELKSQGRLGEFRGHHPTLGVFQELNLDVSTEELLSAERAFTYEALCAMLKSGDTVAWLTPHAAIVGEAGIANASRYSVEDGDHRFRFHADGKDIFAFAHSPGHYWRFAILLFDCWQ
jgi:hypothetical protein